MITIYSDSTKATTLLSVEVDDTSVRNRSIMGDHSITLNFSLAQHIELPVGAYVEFQATGYTLERPEGVKIKHRRAFEYTVQMFAAENAAKRWKFRNTVDGRLKFPLTATPREHLQMFVDNMNRRDSGWAIGSCIDGVEHLVSYDHDYCLDALKKIAEEYETEFEIVGRTVSLHKVEYNKSTPLSVQYGKNLGVKSGIGRTSGDELPVEILYVQGGTDNINPSTYGGRELVLPKGQHLKFDGTHFEDETGYVAANAREYVASSDGLSIQRHGRALSSMAEDSLDLSDIYPKRVCTVGSVVEVDRTNHFYDIIDSNPASNPCPNFEDYLISGETMTVIFQSGMLAGREFEVKYIHNASGGKQGRRFEIVPQEIDGLTMPDYTSGYLPRANDTFVVFHCALPSSYIRDDNSKSGASWDMFRKAVIYLYEHEQQKMTFSAELDGLWMKRDWVNRGGKIVLGGYVSFTDSSVQAQPVLLRITAIKDYINNPESPVVTLSNETITPGFGTTIKQIAAEESVMIEATASEAQAFTKRRFRDAKTTMEALKKEILEGYTEGINPITAQMMQLLVGDESLQYQFTNAAGTARVTDPTFGFNGTTKVFSVTAAASAQNNYLQHLTLKGDGNHIEQSSSHASSVYDRWTLPNYSSAALTDADKFYYLYAKCVKSGTAAQRTGVFILSESAIKLNAENGYYHFLVGVLGRELDGTRSFATLYGFTEITGGRITTDKIVSGDGNTYFDLANSEIGGVIKFKTGTSGLANISEWPGFKTALDAELQNLQDQLDGVIETWYYPGVPTLSNAPASSWTTQQAKTEHIGDLYYDKDTGKAYRFMYDESVTPAVFKWVLIADEAIAQALAAAAAAQDTADSKRRVFVAQPTSAQAYDVGDMWVNATYGSTYNNDVLRCRTAKAAGAAFSISHWTLASRYTDDTAVNTFINGTYAEFVSDIQGQVDGKAQSWYQSTDPSSAWTTPTEKNNHKGDLWCNTNSAAVSGIDPGCSGVWNGASWTPIDVPEAVYDKIDGKSSIYTTMPTSPEVGDLLIPTNTFTTGGHTYTAGHAYKYTEGSVWVEIGYTDDSTVLNFITNTYGPFAQSIQSQVDGKAESWYQNTDPSANWSTEEKADHKCDLWYNTSSATVSGIDPGCSGIWNGSAWEAIDVPEAVYDKIDGKSSIYTTMPANPETGDLLIPTTTFSSGGVVYVMGHAYKYTENEAWIEISYTDDTAVNALAAKLNDDNTFTVVEKRAVRESLKEIANTESVPANYLTVDDEELIVGTSDWELVTEGTYAGWKKSTNHDHSTGSVVRISIDLAYAGGFTLKIASAAESSWDYAFAGKADESGICDATGAIVTAKLQGSTMGHQNEIITLTYSGLAAGAHTIEVGFRKDSSMHTAPDEGYYLIENSYNVVAAGTLKTAFDKCVAAGKTAAANAIASTANTLFSYLINTGHIFAAEDTTVVGSTFRANVIAYFAAWYNALLAASESVGRSDLNYLAQLFANGSTTIAGGAVISNLVGVTDPNTPTKVVAGLNGSSNSDFVDATHGRLMLFAGANGVANAKTANCRIYEDGHIEAISGVFAGYIDTNFVDIGSQSMQISTNRKIATQGGYYSQVLTLPSAATYIGKSVLIANYNYPPYTKTSIAYGTTITIDAYSITKRIGMGGNIDGNAASVQDPAEVESIYIRGGVVEFLGVPVQTSDGYKCRWVLISGHQSILSYYAIP